MAHSYYISKGNLRRFTFALFAFAAAASASTVSAYAQSNSKLVLACNSQDYGVQVVTLDLANNNGSMHWAGGQAPRGAIISAHDDNLVILKSTDDSIVWTGAGKHVHIESLHRHTGFRVGLRCWISCGNAGTQCSVSQAGQAILARRIFLGHHMANQVIQLARQEETASRHLRLYIRLGTEWIC